MTLTFKPNEFMSFDTHAGGSRPTMSGIPSVNESTACNPPTCWRIVSRIFPATSGATRYKYNQRSGVSPNTNYKQKNADIFCWRYEIFLGDFPWRLRRIFFVHYRVHPTLQSKPQPTMSPVIQQSMGRRSYMTVTHILLDFHCAIE